MPDGTDFRITSGTYDVTCSLDAGGCGFVTSLQWERDHSVGPHGFTWLDDPSCEHCGRTFTDAELDAADDTPDFDPRDEPS